MRKLQTITDRSIHLNNECCAARQLRFAPCPFPSRKPARGSESPPRTPHRLKGHRLFPFHLLGNLLRPRHLNLTSHSKYPLPASTAVPLCRDHWQFVPCGEISPSRPQSSGTCLAFDIMTSSSTHQPYLQLIWSSILPTVCDSRPVSSRAAGSLTFILHSNFDCKDSPRSNMHSNGRAPTSGFPVPNLDS